jgi:hypothetical protein
MRCRLNWDPRDNSTVFTSQFESFSDEIASAAESYAYIIFGNVRALSIALTSYSRESSSVWPNVTLSNFDIRTAETEELRDAEPVIYAPLVSVDSLTEWEAYSLEHQGWIDEDWSYRDASVDAGDISPNVYYSTSNKNETPQSSRSVHFPVWQTGPVPHNASIINFDLYQHPMFRNMIDDVMDINHTVMSGVADFNFLLDPIIPDHVSDGHPRSVIFEPVFDDFHENTSRLTGIVVAELAWENMLKNVLPYGSSRGELL